jgi:hypothetical protein
MASELIVHLDLESLALVVWVTGDVACRDRGRWDRIGLYSVAVIATGFYGPGLESPL